MIELLLLGLALLLMIIPFISLIVTSKLKKRILDLELRLKELHGENKATSTATQGKISDLQKQMIELETGAVRATEPAAEAGKPAEVADAPVPEVAQAGTGVATPSAEEAAIPIPESPATPPPLEPPATKEVVTPAPESVAQEEPFQPAVILPDPEPEPEAGSPPSFEQPTPTEPFDWERWMGSRGAALLGGVVLAMAGIYLFKYSIDKGLVTPPIRVAVGLVFGLVCLSISEFLRKKDYILPANACAGGGLVALYGAVFGANPLYHLIGTGTAFAFMSLITLVGGLLASRHRTVYLAYLVMFGGFATPVLISTSSNNAIALFSYLLLLNGGFLWLAREHGWDWLALLGAGMTLFFEMIFIFAKMQHDQVLILAGVILVYTVVYGFFFGKKTEPGSPWRLMQTGGLIFPFFLAFGLIVRTTDSPSFFMTLAMACLLSAAALWQARVQRIVSIPLLAAVGALGLMWSHGAVSHMETDSAWAYVAGLLILAAIFSGFAVFKRTETDLGTASTQTIASCLLAVGEMVLLLQVIGNSALVLPWLIGLIGLSAALWFADAADPSTRFPPIAGALTAIGVWRIFEGVPDESIAQTYAVAALGMTALYQLGAVLFPYRDYRKLAERDGLVMTVGFAYLFLYLLFWQKEQPVMLHIVLALLGLLAAMGAARMGSGSWYLTVVGVMGSVFMWPIGSSIYKDPEGPTLLILQLVMVLMFTTLPLLLRGSFTKKLSTWYGAALAGPVFFLSLHDLYVNHIGAATVGLLPLGLGLLSLASAWYGLRLDASPGLGKSRLVWFAAVASAFITLAIPLQLDNEWLTIGWALEAFALSVLWRKLDHPGLKYLSAALIGAVTFRLIANPWLLDYYPTEGGPIINWLMYTYLIPVAAMLGVVKQVFRLEVGRARPWENRYTGGRPWVGILAGACAILVMFAYLNLAVIRFYSTGEPFSLDFERLPARDLTLSITWILYAVALLAGGIRLRFQALRRVSLGFLMLAIAKVFLYDLGELSDLWRVASLLGLAISLIFISVVYKRFVIDAKDVEENREGP